MVLSPYWDVDFTPRPPTREPIAALREVLADAVKAHLVADVPVGCLLSGGVESSGVAALAGPGLRTYSIGFRDTRDDELPYARQVAASIGAVPTEQRLEVGEARALVPKMLEWFGEPFGDSSAIPTYLVSALARRDVKVALSGDGGDEVFGGYESYARHLRRARFPRLPAWIPDRLSRSPLFRLRGVPTLVDGIRDPLERHIVIHGGFTAAEKRRVVPDARRWDGYDDLWAFRNHWRPERSESLLPYRSRPTSLTTSSPVDGSTLRSRSSPPLLDHLPSSRRRAPPRPAHPGARLSL